MIIHINTIILTILTDSHKSVWNNMPGKWAYPTLLPYTDLSHLTQSLSLSQVDGLTGKKTSGQVADRSPVFLVQKRGMQRVDAFKAHLMEKVKTNF